jgi:carbon storage regulator CsrA
MLVLSRKNCESVVVGDPAGSGEQMLKITVLEIHKDKVKLGFETAGHFPVNRWEVWQEIPLSIRPEGRRKHQQGNDSYRHNQRRISQQTFGLQNQRPSDMAMNDVLKESLHKGDAPCSRA